MNEGAREAGAVAIPVPEGSRANAISSPVEFIVHARHTCDGCFRTPIIGRRYASGSRPNYDLCAECFDAYGGPDIGLKETALPRDRKASREFALKLRVVGGGEEQVRRVHVSDVWDGAAALLSFAKMMSAAAGRFLQGGEEDLSAFLARARATYVDGDGDEITLSSDAELGDAFRQAVSGKKPFRIAVNIPGDKPRQAVARVGVPKRIQVKKAAAGGRPPPSPAGESPAAKAAPPPFEEEFFIHARHTCDGCSRTPIVGTRWHATQIPDFDLCARCHGNYKGGEGDFVPEVHDRDRRMQRKWLRRQLMGSVRVRGSGGPANFSDKIQGIGATAAENDASGPKAPEAKTPEKPIPAGDAVASLQETQEPEDPMNFIEKFQETGAEEEAKFQKAKEAAKIQETGATSAKDNSTSGPKGVDGDAVASLKEPQEPVAEPAATNKTESATSSPAAEGTLKAPIKQQLAEPGAATETKSAAPSPAAGHTHESPAEQEPAKLDVTIKTESATPKPAVDETHKIPIEEPAKPDAPAAEGVRRSLGKQEPSELNAAMAEQTLVQQGSTKPDALAVGETPNSHAEPEAPKPDAPAAKSPDPPVEQGSAEPDAPAVKEPPESPAATQDGSFLSDADGNGSIAEAIGRTLDVCFAAMEEAMADGGDAPADDGRASHETASGVPAEDGPAVAAVDTFSVASSVEGEVAAAAAASVDTFSMASSGAWSVTDVLREIERLNEGDGDGVALAAVPSKVTVTAVSKSGPAAGEEDGREAVKVEAVSDGEDEWSVISD